jgi:hypothetical protein
MDVDWDEADDGDGKIGFLDPSKDYTVFLRRKDNHSLLSAYDASLKYIKWILQPSRLAYSCYFPQSPNAGFATPRILQIGQTPIIRPLEYVRSATDIEVAGKNPQ